MARIVPVFWWVMVAATLFGGWSRPVYGQSDTPTELIIVRPLWITITNEVPTDIQSVSETALASMKVCNWISVVGYAWYPPIPWNWCAGRTDVSYWYTPTLGTSAIIIDDRQLPYADWAEARGLTRSGFSRNSADPPPVPGGDDIGGGDGPRPTWPPPVHDPYPWLEIAFSTNLTNFADLTLHNATSNMWQLLFKTNLDANLPWSAGQIFDNTVLGTNEIHFNPVNYTTNARCFFRAVSGGPVIVQVLNFGLTEAFEPSPTGFFEGQDVNFLVQRQDQETVTNDFHIYYRMSGTASNGWDYSLLSGEVTIASGDSIAVVTIHPTNHWALDFDEVATINLVVSNGYLVDPDFGAASIVIHAYPFIPVALLDLPMEVDGYTNSDWLLVSVNQHHNDALENTNNFLRIDTNGNAVGWSGVTGIQGEVKMATVKDTTNGFHAGEMFFTAGDPGTIGWVSTNAAQWTNNWLTLPGETNHIRGGLYVDRTGIWSNSLIAVAGEGVSFDQTIPRSVWRISADRNPILVTNISAKGLEAVIPLPDDVGKYGPWAGKLLVGDEFEHLIYAISTSSTVSVYDTAEIVPGGFAAPGNFVVVRSNEDLYCTLQAGNHDESILLKISRTFLTNAIGDLLVTQTGETVTANGFAFPTLNFIHWEAARTNFATRRVFFPPETGGLIVEHSGTAPANIRTLP